MADDFEDDDELDEDLDDPIEEDVDPDELVDEEVDPLLLDDEEVLPPIVEDIEVVAVEVVVEEEEASDDDDAIDLEEELHPDDVEDPLDVLLAERTASAAIDEDEDELEDADDPDDERGGGTGKVVPRRPGEFVCSSCFLVLPQHMIADQDRMLCRDCV